MKEMTDNEAAEYASWYRCLSDATRIRVLNAIAVAGRPVTVGEIVASVGKSQSTVSRHLRILAESRFIFMEPDGVRTLVTVNGACMTELPEASAIIMGSAERPVSQ
jgi:DNA-binding transcriptional ArsR family regulator